MAEGDVGGGGGAGPPLLRVVLLLRRVLFGRALVLVVPLPGPLVADVAQRVALGHPYAATAAPPLSSWPNFARLMYWPTPGEATSSPFSTRTLPRSRTISGVPVTSVPS